MITKKKHASDAEFKDEAGPVAENMLTPHELAFLTCTTAEIIMLLVDLDLIVPCARRETLLFHVETVQQVYKIMRLRRHLQVSFDSMALILDLLDRIDALETRISEHEC
ncbi:chaperone modulator CbpM [Verrucomicrobiota bacterium]